jgi:hypothetical protein
VCHGFLLRSRPCRNRRPVFRTAPQVRPRGVRPGCR